MSKVVRCPECSWSKTAHSEVPEVVTAVEEDLKGHLAADHDWTWQRAAEHAQAWARSLIPGLYPGDGHIASGGLRVTRTAACPNCAWTLRSPSEDVFEVSHCSAELEEHLRTEHGLAQVEAQRIAEAWALPLLQTRPK